MASFRGRGRGTQVVAAVVTFAPAEGISVVSR